MHYSKYLEHYTHSRENTTIRVFYSQIVNAKVFFIILALLKTNESSRERQDTTNPKGPWTTSQQDEKTRQSEERN